MSNLSNNLKNVHEIRVFSNNWLSKKFKKYPDRFHVIMWTWVLFGLFPAILFFITSKIDNTFFMENQLGLIQDYRFHPVFILVPWIISLAIAYFPNFPHVLQSLRDVIVFESDESITHENLNSKSENKSKVATLKVTEYNNILKFYEDRIRGKGKFEITQAVFILGCLMFATLGAKQHYFGFESYTVDIWSSRNFMTSFTARTIYELITFGFILPLVIYKFIFILHTMRSICRRLTEMEVIRLRPLNPDKAG